MLALYLKRAQHSRYPGKERRGGAGRPRKERLRLFYVGIMPAKNELIVTWNTGRQGAAIPSLPFSALMGWWEAVGMNM